MNIVQRFLKYISVDTQSDNDSTSSPTTPKQYLLGNILVEELQALGIANAYIDEYSYVYAYLPGNVTTDTTIGLIAHLDTATELTGAGVKPIIIDSYNGETITVNEKLGIFLSPSEFPSLLKQVGHELITTDGTTLLGADDKAGIAIIMDVVKQLIDNPDLPHPNIIVTFTPDEEVGKGIDNFNFEFYQEHNCHMAYTLDGGDVSTINFENFNAAAANITITGKSIHPGSAKNRMINSLHLAMEFHSMLPSDMIPANTEGYEGFNHLNNVEGGVACTKMHYIIRNHDMKKFREQIKLFKDITNYLNNKYGENRFAIDITDTYYNMRELVLKNPEVLEYATKALIRENLVPVLEPIRGGTDGAHLSYKGIITPNLGTGGANFHGPYEYVSTNDMKKMVKVVLTILKVITEK